MLGTINRLSVVDMVQVHIGKRGKYSNAETGRYYPLHPEKYKGSQLPVFKSGLERRMMMYLDRNSSILSWSYEPKAIRYIDKTSCPLKVRRYFIDFVAQVKAGPLVKTVWLEVKPLCEATPPKNPKNINASLLWIKNNCKWQAATQLAKSKGAEFHVITEEQLN